jgi:hypothetical protein
MENQPCVRCSRQLRVPQTINETGDAACSVFLFCQSLGIRPRVKSKASRGLFCASCMISVAQNTLTPEGAFNAMIWEQLRDIVRQTGAFHDIARMEIVNPHARLKLMPGSKPDGTLTTKMPLIAEAV